MVHSVLSVFLQNKLRQGVLINLDEQLAIVVQAGELVLASC